MSVFDSFVRKHDYLVGDAPGDCDAAEKNGVHYYPILVNREKASWDEAIAVAYDKLRSDAQKSRNFWKILGVKQEAPRKYQLSGCVFGCRSNSSSRAMAPRLRGIHSREKGRQICPRKLAGIPR